MGAPVRQENHLLKVASQSPALFESVSLNRSDSRAVATQIVDSWNRPVLRDCRGEHPRCHLLNGGEQKVVTDGHVCVAYTLARLTKLFE